MPTVLLSDCQKQQQKGFLGSYVAWDASTAFKMCFFFRGLNGVTASSSYVISRTGAFNLY